MLTRTNDTRRAGSRSWLIRYSNIVPDHDAIPTRPPRSRGLRESVCQCRWVSRPDDPAY